MPINPQLAVRSRFAVKDVRIFNAVRQAMDPAPVGNVRPPEVLKPQIFLVEHYRLTSFKGDLSRDAMIGSFSLAPHSEFTYTLIQKTTTAKTSELTTTVMESQDQTAATQLNSHIKDSADSKFGKNSSNYGFDANFHGEAEVGLGSGSADANVHARGSAQDLHDEIAKSTESALDSQVSATATFRSQQVHSGRETDTATTESEVKIEKKTQNPTDEPMNMGVFQLKEEIVTLLTLVNVEVAFRNTNAAQDKTVPLGELDGMLEATLAGAEARARLKADIKAIVEKVRDFRDEARSLIVADPENPGGFVVNRSLESTYELKKPDGTLRRKLVVPGIIIKDYRRYLVKPNATIELNLGTI